MHRRHFFLKTGLAMFSSGLSLPALQANPTFRSSWRKPPRLKKGATIGLIAPASPVSEAKLNKALANLAALGFQVKEGTSLRARHGYLAGTDNERLHDLHWAFADPEVDAVWCVRGGYGATRLLPDIDYTLIRKHPKPFIGYSDVTALHLAIGQKTGLTTFHGPVAASDFPTDTLQHFEAALVQPVEGYTLQAQQMKAEEASTPFTISAGRASGRLTGGNLSLLAALAGTPFEPKFRQKMVFMEDVGEQPYRIDRLLTQLLQATDLKQAAGIALGVFADCKPRNPMFSLTLQETLQDRLGHLGIPVVYGLPLGHIAHQATFSYGVQTVLDADKQTLRFMESGVK